MADGSREDRTDPKQINEITFSVLNQQRDHIKKCSGEPYSGDKVKLSFYTELQTSESCEKSDTRGVVADRAETTHSLKSLEGNAENTEDRKKRCFDRYDSSESSDSGVAVLSSTESSGCSSSDITEPGSPPSPGSSCGVPEEGAGARMPPWACEPAPPGPRRIAPQPAPTRRPPPPLHRRITEYFNHKMKPHNGLKRETLHHNLDDTKKKCLPKNGVSHDLEKYISYLSQTLSPKVLVDTAAQKSEKRCDFNKVSNNASINGLIDYSRPKDNMDKVHTMPNGFVNANKQKAEPSVKEKSPKNSLNGLVDPNNHGLNLKMSSVPSANNTYQTKKQSADSLKRKMTVSSSDLIGVRVKHCVKPDSTNFNDVVSSTTRLDSKINGVTYGSNNISLNPIAPKLAPSKREAPSKTSQPAKRTNRKSSACIANSKNLTWSKANNLKQNQLQKQNCANLVQNPVKNLPNDPNTTPKINIPNGVRQIPIAMNGNLNNMNVPVPNLQNCHQINLQPSCNGTVTSTTLGSFVTVPPNVMLTTLRIPQNGISAQTVNEHNNMANYTRQNPNKLNGSFMFPFVQNINGVVQIPNIMTKVPSFGFPQSTQIATQQHDHLQNQQATQILINGTLLKLANTMTPSYTNVNKTMPPTSQSIGVNKNSPGMPNVGMTVQSKSNYAVNLSHPMLVSQPGFIVTSVPNINVKETWSNTSTNSASSTQNATCLNPIVHHPPPVVTNFTSSIPIAPVKPPDNPIQGTDPPSSTVIEPEIKIENINKKCDFPWLTKTLNNNNVPLDKSNMTRPFAQVCNFSDKLSDFNSLNNVIGDKCVIPVNADNLSRTDKSSEEIRRVEEVARREDTIFTQITVLKDVSSNVHSSMIEANYSCATTESSESGIGTDKSIDSPSDSQTSKECDDDSSLSLSVSVCSNDLPSCQKSPILKQPKTLRFPPKSLIKGQSDKRTSSTDTTSSITVCLWENCKKEFESDTDLLEHLQVNHVETQVGRENYVCQWQKCKVKGKPSCSRLWLERHALSHGGNKPFKCIVDGCGRRFSTQILLERHVNNHFNEQSSSTSSSKKSTDSTPKLIRRNGKKLRYRRQPWSARMFDFFDAGTMEGLAWRLARSTRWRLGGASPFREPAGGHSLVVFATLAASRYNVATGRREALVTYFPPNVLEDEWLPEKEVKRVRRVEISTLPTHTKVKLYDQFCSSYRQSVVTPPRETSPPPPPRVLPQRNCTSSRLLNNLIAKQKKPAEPKEECPVTQPILYVEDEKVEVTGAKKRKMGRRHGGNAFWPCGR